MQITPDTSLGELLTTYPEAEKIIRKHLGETVGCLSCPMRQMESLSMGAEVHGLNKKQISALVAELQEKFPEK